jgi:membrane-associated phospholipid phosphatase
MLCLLLQGPAPSPSFGQAPDAGPLDLLAPRQIGSDLIGVARFPLRMQQKHYLRVLGFTGLTATLVSSLDAPIHRYASGGVDGAPSSPVPHAMAGPGRVYDQIGPSNFILGVAGTFAVGGLIAENNTHVHTSIRIIEAVALTKLITGALKTTLGRSRPFTGEPPYDAGLLEFEDNGHARRSMPSGHTSKIFAAASVIAHQYDSWWVQVPAYATAASAGIQRIESGKHWLSDVVVGAALGYLLGEALANQDRRHAKKRITYDPILSSQRVGLSLRF